jgi:hypothetical protein
MWRSDLETDLYFYNKENYFRRNLVKAIDSDFVPKLINQFNLKVLFAKKPQMVAQQLDLPGIPSPPHGVYHENFSFPNSTLGVYAENIYEQKGFVMCLHSLAKDVDDAMKIIEKGKTKVTVNGATGTIITYDPISDSCFVVLDDQRQIDNSNFSSIRILQGKTPRQYEKASFEGFRSGPLSTIITGWTPDLPFVKKYNQLKIYTNPITNPGDSGCALKDSDGLVCGFAFMRSGLNETPQFSSWIWAESVFKYHQLNYYKL